MYIKIFLLTYVNNLILMCDGLASLINGEDSRRTDYGTDLKFFYSSTKAIN